MILQDNKIYFKNHQVSTIEEVPPGNWLLRWEPRELFFYLERMGEFTLPEKIYGDCDYLTDRYLTTFNKYDKNLGISLSGVKGTGKSLTAKMLAMKSNLPVIIINEPFCGTEFNSFMEGIQQNAVIFIDEFEKVYGQRKDQELMLSLLDGSFQSKKIFLFTSNETASYNNYLMNRPGRIHYFKEYNRIDDETLQQIIDENLIDKTKEDGFKNIINLIDDANIDMVFSLIREMNDFGETAKEAVNHLNISISGNAEHEVFIHENGVFYKGSIGYNPLFHGHITEWLMLDEELMEKNGVSKEDIKKIKDNGNDEKHFQIKLSTCVVTKATSTHTNIKTQDGKNIVIKKLSPYRYVF